MYDDNIINDIFINPCRKIFLKNLNERELDFKWGIRMTSFWMNQNNKSDYNVMHNHIPNNFSGIWYLKAPVDCGQLVLQNGDYNFIKLKVILYYFNDPLLLFLDFL